MMSGTVELGSGVRWSAASWLFEWVVNFVADNVGDDDVAVELREVVDANLGWVSTEDFTEPQRAAIIRVLADALEPGLEEELPGFAVDHDATRETVRQLVGLARSSH